MAGVSTLSISDGIGLVLIDNPPVNALGIAARRALDHGIESLIGDGDVKAIVLACAGRTFFAGADISEFGKPLEQPDLDVVFARIESAPKPVIAAIHGTALGGGYEAALVCHYRIAVPSARVGLPEVHLGLLPGAGGTQRLPRLVGVEAALDIIALGRPVGAKQALELGMIDRLATEGALIDDAMAFARQIVAEDAPLRRVRDMGDKIASARGHPEIYADFLKKHSRAFRGFKAPGHIVKAIEAAAEAPSFDDGMRREAELFGELVRSAESAAQRYYFFAERETGKIADVPPGTAVAPVNTVGVIGAGTMGGGIAMNFIEVGIPVTLVEAKQEQLDRGLSIVRGNYESAAKKGRLTIEQVEQRMARITPALSLDALAEVDLVIEAVFEEMSLKQDIFRQLDAVCKPEAILASNTSMLDLDRIAAVTKRPEQVIGLHFFSPANVMRLLEIVRGDKTSGKAIATAVAVAKRIAKVPVLSRVCEGFIVNRIMSRYMQAADRLTLEGLSPPVIDQAMFDYGFAMGPFRMIDLVGLDVIGREAGERTLSGDLVKRGRLGQKKNGGFYDYDQDRNATFSPIAADVIATLARDWGIGQGKNLSSDEILARLLYPVVNEGAKVLEEGIALRASDVDVAAILGYNWPIYTGGPMFWADTVGLSKIVSGLIDMGIAPAKLLLEKAEQGGSFTR